MNNPIVRVENGEKYYNRRKSNELHVVNHLNLELPASGMVAVFGKSGCGKTTMLNVIGGLDRLESGSIEIFGQDLRRKTDEIRNRYIGYVFQNYNLNNSETVFENVADALLLCGLTDTEEIRTRVTAALANVGMEKFRDRTPDTLSGGQQQRVAIARALVKNPPILLADEPTGNLDETNTVMVMDILKEVSRNHLVLLVTHEANLVDYYCDRVIEIVDGAVNSIRENEGAEGFVARNKNDIYLGELPKKESVIPGVKIEYYGEPAGELTLQIVSVDGKLFLKSNNESLRILDSSSEVHLKNGVFDEAREASFRSEKKPAMNDLPPVEVGKHFGRLYHWKNAIGAAWRENFFSRKKKKKGKRLLRAVLALLSVVLVFLSASFGVQIKNYFDIKNDVSENLFYLPIDPRRDYSALADSIGKNGIDIAYSMEGLYSDSELNLTFSGGDFMTAQSGTVKGKGVMLTSDQLGSARLLTGTGQFSTPGDLVISSAMADQMLKSSDFSYLDSYESLIGLVCDRNSCINGRYLRIVGVVENAQRCFYLDPMVAAQSVFASIGVSQTIQAFSAQSLITVSPSPGTVAAVNRLGSYYGSEVNHKVGEKLEILGKTFTVSRVFTEFNDFSYYAEYVNERKGVQLLSLNEYLNSSIPDASLNDLQKEYEWFFVYYPQYLSDFVKEVCQNRGYYEDYFDFAIAEKKDLLEYLGSFDRWNKEGLHADVGELYAAYLYRNANGSWPTVSQAKDESESEFYEKLEERRDWDSFNRVNGYSKYGSSRDYFEVILNDGDYQSLICSVGNLLGNTVFYVYGEGDETFYTAKILIHSTDTAATEAFLASEYHGFEVTPAEMLSETLASSMGDIIGGAVSILVVLGSLSLCIFFIMRSSFMSRIKEVGIQRAIGVSKSNLLFKFGIEVVMLTTLTELIGFALSSYVLNYLSGASLFGEVFFFPWWMAGLLLCVLYLFSIFFGLLPAVLLLGKTPSEILSKYDI